MTKKLLFVTTLLLVVTFVAVAADLTGKWTYETQGRNGAQQQSFTLKQDGNTLTGSVPGMGRGGAEPPPPTEITNGKVDGNKFSFEVKRAGRGGGDPTITKYEGTYSGDEMKLKIQRPAMGGGGDVPPPTEVTAKRATS